MYGNCTLADSLPPWIAILVVYPFKGVWSNSEDCWLGQLGALGGLRGNSQYVLPVDAADTGGRKNYFFNL